MKNTLLKSTLILTLATLVSKILGSIFRIPLQNIAGDEVVGIFSLVYPVYMVALTLSVAGIPVAISKLIAEANAKQDGEQVYRIYRTATILSALFGLVSFLIIFIFLDGIAASLGGESVKLSLMVVSITLLVAPYMAVFRGYFQGFGDMRPTAISQVIEQLIRVALILGIAYMMVGQAFGPETISGGIMVSSFIGAFASLLYLRFLFARSSLKPKKEQPYTWQNFREIGKVILKISIPICIGAITMALINFVDSFTIPKSLILSGVSEGEIPYWYGIYGRGLALVQIATVFSSSIVLPLIPLISKSIAERDYTNVRSLIEKTHYYAHLLSWPVAIGMFALTLPINMALFKDLQGSDMLALSNLSALFMSLTILGTGILQGMDKERLAARIILGIVVLKIATNFLFVQQFGLVGAALSTVLVYLIAMIINTYYIWKTHRYAVWHRRLTSIAVSALIMGAVVGIPTLFFDFTSWSRLIVFVYLLASIFIGMVIYFGLLLATKGIRKQELMSLPGLNKVMRKKNQ